VQQLSDERDRLVLVVGEANSHTREDPIPGDPELVYLVARRLGDGATFDAVLAPRRRLGPLTARHLGVDEAALRAGEPVAQALARFQAFLRPDDLPAGWGTHARHLLAQEGLALASFLDLRPLAARRLRRSPGAPAQAVAALDPAAADRPAAPVPRGRAGRTLAVLADLVDALTAPARGG
jgi:hypothetical protein